MSPESIEIDGAVGEGGGQMLRSALALSVVTGRPFRMVNVRAGRPKPGLAAQHLAAVRAAALFADAEVSGAEPKSTVVSFRPRRRKPDGADFRFDIGTAGSTTLLLHALYLPLALSGGGTLALSGGTHVAFAPPFEHAAFALAPLLKRMGVSLSLSLDSAGYYPRGGGRVTAKVSGAPRPVRLPARGRLLSAEAIIVLSNLPEHVARRERRTLTRMLERLPLETRTLRPPAPSPGNCVAVALRFEKSEAVFSAPGERGRRAEDVAAEAAKAALDFLETEAVVDRHAADQLMLPAALAGGESRYIAPALTGHMKTNAEVIRRFLPVEIRFREGAVTEVRISTTDRSGAG